MQIFNHNINQFILMFQKGACQYEYMKDWEKFSENLWPGK